MYLHRPLDAGTRLKFKVKTGTVDLRNMGNDSGIWTRTTMRCSSVTAVVRARTEFMLWERAPI